MTARESTPCNCPEQPCVCSAEGYAAGRNQAIADIIARFDGPPHPEGCVCEICGIKRAWSQALADAKGATIGHIRDEIEL